MGPFPSAFLPYHLLRTRGRERNAENGRNNFRLPCLPDKVSRAEKPLDFSLPPRYAYSRSSATSNWEARFEAAGLGSDEMAWMRRFHALKQLCELLAREPAE